MIESLVHDEKARLTQCIDYVSRLYDGDAGNYPAWPATRTYIQYARDQR